MKLENLENTEIAFAHRTDKELFKRYCMFSMIDKRFLTQIGNNCVRSAIALRLPVKSIIRKTLFNEFCGGESLQEAEQVIAKMSNCGVGVILDYAVEGEKSAAGFIDTKKHFLQAIERAKETQIPFAAIKVTGFVSFSLLEKVTAKLPLTEQEKIAWEQGQGHLDEICQKANESGVALLVDAEESWIQDAIDILTNEMMAKYNKDSVTIYNTFQLYRHDRLQYLKDSYEEAKEKGYLLGAKLVRGAYFEKENLRAKKKGYVSPIHINKENVDIDYNKGLDFCMDHLDQIYLCAGTHNEHSIVYLTELIEKNTTKDNPRIHFAQLYGMGDHISYNLAHEKYNVLKVLPYGPVLKAVPYLIRRAEENSSIIGQTSRELSLIIRERKRRKGSRRCC